MMFSMAVAPFCCPPAAYSFQVFPILANTCWLWRIYGDHRSGVTTVADVRQYLVGSICISPMAVDDEHLFTCLPGVYMSLVIFSLFLLLNTF